MGTVSVAIVGVADDEGDGNNEDDDDEGWMVLSD